MQVGQVDESKYGFHVFRGLSSFVVTGRG